MKRLALLTALFAHPVAAAETFDCQLSRTCTTLGNACSDDVDATVITLTIADDGKSAQLSSGDQSLDMALIDTAPQGRTFLALRAGEGVGLFSLTESGALVASSNEFDADGPMGMTATGTCRPKG